MTRSEIAGSLRISPRQLLRKLDKVVEEGGALRQSLALPTIQGCEDNLLEWPDVDIQACADDAFEPLLAFQRPLSCSVSMQRPRKPLHVPAAFRASVWANIGDLENLPLMLGCRTN